MKNTGKLQLLNFTYTFPMSWAQLSRRQLLRIFKAQIMFGADNGLFVLHFIWVCLRLKPRLFQNEKTRFLITQVSPVDKMTIAHSKDVLGWFFDKETPMPYLFKWFWHRGRLYVGPYRRLTKINVSELCYAMYYHQQYHATQNPDHLHHLIDVLYRPVNLLALIKRIFSPDPASDIRVPLNDYMHDKRAKRLSTLPKHICLLIIAQWATAQDAFAKQYPKAFRKGGSKKANPRDMSKFLISSAGEKFGTVNEAERADAAKVFEHVEMNLEQVEKMKENKK